MSMILKLAFLKCAQERLISVRCFSVNLTINPLWGANLFSTYISRFDFCGFWQKDYYSWPLGESTCDHEGEKN